MSRIQTMIFASLLVAACDKTPETCHARFGNILNFRGEPHIPGNDKVFSYPTQGGGSVGQ